MMNNTDNLKPLLDKSCEELKPAIEQQLNARRNLVMQQKHKRSYRWGYALAPVALIATLWFNTPQSPQLTVEEQALYEDIELLILEDDLTFLDEMDVSDWLVEESSESTDA